VALVFVDGRNVQRSQWPNLSDEDLVERVEAWAARHGHEAVIVFDGETSAGAIGSGQESADDWLIREVPKHPGAWLVTSDRALRDAAGPKTDRVIGGGAFLEEVLRHR
jgi:predicted PilT family ATPase